MNHLRMDNGQLNKKKMSNIKLPFGGPMSNEKGLTLVEVLISSSIAALVGGLLIMIMVNSTGLFYEESSKVSMGLNTNEALAQVRKSIKESSAILPSYVAGSVTYTSGESTIVLKVPSLDSSGNIISSTFDYFVFSRDLTNLRFKTFPDPVSSRKAQDQIFSTSLDDLRIQYFNSVNPPVEVDPVKATKVRMTVTLKQKNGLTYEINISTSEANLRND